MANFRASSTSLANSGGNDGKESLEALVNRLSDLQEELKQSAVDKPTGVVWESFRQIVAHVLRGTSGFTVPNVLLPVHSLTTGTIVKVARGTLGRGERVLLQIVSDISEIDGGTYNITVSDGEFSQIAQYWSDDRAAVEETGMFGTLACTAVWLPTEGCVLIRGVIAELDGDVLVGNPPLYQPAPALAPSVLLPPTQPGISGIPIGITILGTADGDTTVNKVPPVVCRGACKHCPITTSDGYIETASAAQSSHECVAIAFPPPDFSLVKDASRGTKRQLDDIVTNRVRRYALISRFFSCRREGGPSQEPLR
jgi:hypothetical protein